MCDEILTPRVCSHSQAVHKLSSVRELSEHEKTNPQDTAFYGSEVRDWFTALVPPDPRHPMAEDSLSMMSLKDAISAIKKNAATKPKKLKVPYRLIVQLYLICIYTTTVA